MGLNTVLRFQWRAYWRRVTRPGSLTVSNQGILLIVAVLVLFKYIQALSVAGSELANGKTRTFELLLLAVFGAWLFPLLSSARLSVTSRALLHLPLSIRDLFVIRVGSLLLPPFAWMIVGGSLALAFPLSHAMHPFTGMVATFFYVATCWLVGLTLAHLISIRVWRKLIAVLFLVGGAAAGAYVVQTQGAIVEGASLRLFPSRFVLSAAFGEQTWVSVGLLVVFSVVAACTALWSFQASLNAPDQRRDAKINGLPIFFGKTGPLSYKDLRYFLRMLDPYFGFLVSAIGCLYLVIAETQSPEVFWILIIMTFFPNASATFNSFGLDNRDGLNRYALLPLSGKEIIWSKNTAFLGLVSLELAPMFVFAVWRLGATASLVGFFEALLLALAYMTWGNFLAINHRFRMEFYRFSSGGSPVDALAGVMFGSLPGVIVMALFAWGYWSLIPLALIIYIALYLTSLSWAGKRVAQM